MSDILDPNERFFNVEFQYTPPGCILRYANDDYGIALTRGEMEALYSRIQDIKAEELVAAGWLEEQADYGRWFFPPKSDVRVVDSIAIDAAWEVMEGAENDSRN